MRKFPALLAVAALAIAPAGALAAKPKPKAKKPSPRAKVFRATFKAVGPDGLYTTMRFGKAQLVDGRKHDKLSIHLRHLTPRTVYGFTVRKAPDGTDACVAGAPAGIPVGTWTTRRPLRTNAAGNANRKATSKDFKSVAGETYFVAITDALGQTIACGELKRNKRAEKKLAHSKKAHKKGHKGRKRHKH